MQEQKQDRPICPACNRPMAKAGTGLSGTKIKQVYKCMHVDCPLRGHAKLGEEVKRDINYE